MDEMFVIWNGKYGMYWGPSNGGYTPAVSLAGLYTKREADDILLGSGKERAECMKPASEFFDQLISEDWATLLDDVRFKGLDELKKAETEVKRLEGVVDKLLEEKNAGRGSRLQQELSTAHSALQAAAIAHVNGDKEGLRKLLCSNDAQIEARAFLRKLIEEAVEADRMAR
jgi:hypothetical protein